MRVPDLLQSSKEQVQLADHLVHVSYPLLQDPKLFGTAIKSLFVAASRSAKVLAGELDGPFTKRLDNFRQAVLASDMRTAHVDLLSELHTHVQQIKLSSSMFPRNQTLVLLDQDTPHELTYETVRDLTLRTKLLVADMHSNERRN